MTLAITVTLNDVNNDPPVSTNVAVSNPLGSSAEYLCSLNPTQTTKIVPTHHVNKLQEHVHIHMSCNCTGGLILSPPVRICITKSFYNNFL